MLLSKNISRNAENRERMATDCPSFKLLTLILKEGIANVAKCGKFSKTTSNISLLLTKENNQQGNLLDMTDIRILCTEWRYIIRDFEDMVK
jgi:hypothetical protein